MQILFSGNLFFIYIEIEEIKFGIILDRDIFLLLVINYLAAVNFILKQIQSF